MRSFNSKEIKQAGNLVMEKFNRDKEKYLRDNQVVKLPPKERVLIMDASFRVAIRTKFGSHLTVDEFVKAKRLIGKILRRRQGVYRKSPMSPQKRKSPEQIECVKVQTPIQKTTTQDLFPSTIPVNYP